MTTHKRTHEELGVFHARPDGAHYQTPYPFAPGVIDGPDKHGALSCIELLGLTLLALFCFAALLVCAYLIFGYITLSELLSWMLFQ